jgi:hypothetical protein
MQSGSENIGQALISTGSLDWVKAYVVPRNVVPNYKEEWKRQEV